jgi:hypothetical protein
MHDFCRAANWLWFGRHFGFALNKVYQQALESNETL